MNIQTFKLIDGKVLVHMLLEKGETVNVQHVAKMLKEIPTEVSESSSIYPFNFNNPRA